MPQQAIDRKVSRKLYPTKRKADQSIRREIFERDDFTCQHCGIKPSNIPKEYDGKYTLYVHPPHLSFSYLVVDHIIPWKKGGTIESYNLQVLCDPCNCRKGDGTNGV